MNYLSTNLYIALYTNLALYENPRFSIKGAVYFNMVYLSVSLSFFINFTIMASTMNFLSAFSYYKGFDSNLLAVYMCNMLHLYYG